MPTHLQAGLARAGVAAVVLGEEVRVADAEAASRVVAELGGVEGGDGQLAVHQSQQLREVEALGVLDAPLFILGFDDGFDDYK